MHRARIGPRQLLAIAVVVAIGALFAWRELGGEAASDSVLDVAEAALKVEVGERAPNFTLATPDGGELQLSDFAGQAVVLNFWATWCAPCRAEMPALQQIADEHAATAELTVVAVNLMESADAVRSFAEELGLSFPMVLDQDGVLAERYGLIGLPGTFFIDAGGVLRARVLGQLHGDLLSDGLEAVLGDAVATR